MLEVGQFENIWPDLSESRPYLEMIRNRVFIHEAVELDGKHFTECSFTDCVLEYYGGETVLERTSLSRCRHVFYGNARMVVQYLQTMKLMPFNSSEWGEFSSEILH